jgi:type VI secretion system protein ImpK
MSEFGMQTADRTLDPSPAPWAAAVHRAARPLIALATQLRTAVPAKPATTATTLATAVETFERELGDAGCDQRSVTAASYLLCVWLDEVIAPHAWAAATWPAHSLLQRFHGEADGRARVFQLLERLFKQPDADRPLLELFHVCLSLGLQGRWQDVADGPRQLATLRTRLAEQLHLNPTPLASQALSARWQPAVAPRRPGRGRRLVVAGLTLIALAGLGVYSGSQWLLARQADQVFASLQGLERASRTGPGAGTTAAMTTPAGSSPPAPSSPGRLSTALVTDVTAGGIAVRDDAHRSMVVLPADSLFRPGTTQLASTQLPLLERVALALAAQGGRVLVTAYARPDTPRSARLPSAAQLADEWARQVAQVLEPRLAAGSVASEGLVAATDGASGGQPGEAVAGAGARNRVEITLFP